MKITDKKVAKKLVPKVVKYLVPANMPKEGVEKLINVIGANIIKYGYQKQELITKATIAVCQEFGDISVKFFQILNETVQLSMQLKNHRYDRIAEFIMLNEDVPLSKRVELFLLFEEKERKAELGLFKVRCELAAQTATQILGVLFIGLFTVTTVKETEETKREHEKTLRDPNYNKTQQTEIKEREKTERERIKHDKK
ncbi:MAG: hypothetical protein NC205_05925 [Prevotella sp.]|nr:hypothetical protein [Alistipes senegalensis]MCM1358114.1 hypothetical protein [Prevotella sp.]MCM1474046.1 hypothetical protein [Muribaculaceae bacterium]